MSCCMDNLWAKSQENEQNAARRGHNLIEAEKGPSSTPIPQQTELLVPDIHCAGCIQKIERALSRHPAVTEARVNLTSKRVSISYWPTHAKPDDFAPLIEGLGFSTLPFCPKNEQELEGDPIGRELLTSMAVAGFAAANVMLLSVSVWAGASDATRDLFHWISASIALPAVVYAGRPFFRSAYAALKSGHLNMDVPISLAVILAAGASLFETINHGPHAYFDASVMLLFFLLIGRTLDHMMREKARSTVAHLIKLSAKGATILDERGTPRFLTVSELEPGMIMLIPAGERVAADGEIVRGKSDIDRSLVTGESVPETVREGDQVQAGLMNLTGPLEVRVTAAGGDSSLSEIIRLMESAEQGKAHYVRLANKAAQIYAPVVHVLAGMSFLAWLSVTGGDWHTSLLIAISVLIITCPCALGLAVPVVQIVASGRLFRNGVIIKDGAALEKLAEIETIIFDKTGTLTKGLPQFSEALNANPNTLSVAAGLASKSKHPLAQALYKEASARGVLPAQIEEIVEHPGQGLSGVWGKKHVRLGSPGWCGVAGKKQDLSQREHLLRLVLKVDDDHPAIFLFEDELRSDAAKVVRDLVARGYQIEILSGDRPQTVRHVANALGITRFQSRVTPQAKTTHIHHLAESGHKVLMVGDGINDAPSLAAAHTSMAPASASEIGRTAADFVFLGDKLEPVLFAQKIAQRTNRLVKQNFALAVIYNMIAVPIAVLGYASPLIAAIAMSSSSLLVTLNALRLKADWKVFRVVAKFIRDVLRKDSTYKMREKRTV